MARKGRGRLNSIQLLPVEVNHVVQWAAAELQDTQRTQLDIYQEFSDKLKYAIRESRGELDFKIPSFSAFNRYSVNLDAMTRDLNETREMAAAIADTFDAEESDDLTLVAVEAIKSAVFTLLASKRGKIDFQDLKRGGEALRAALSAQNISTQRRERVEAQVKEAMTQVSEVVKKAAVSQATIDEINRRLGVV